MLAKIIDVASALCGATFFMSLAVIMVWLVGKVVGAW